ncbi:hypothetical protein [Enterococcus florum]|uniref:hypothetical protein n=1 Tax=Enterococcus florum TaxID=2480627 RepID=UPI001D1320FE|nr:hypothetical protein [Enterococcus florum]
MIRRQPQKVSELTAQAQELLKKTGIEDLAMCMVTHDAKVAVQSERTLFMKDGEIVDELKLAKFVGNDSD